MSINKIYLPELEVLESYLKDNGSNEFYNRYLRNKDAVIGPNDSHAFCKEFYKFYNSTDIEFNQIPQLKLF